MLAIDLESWQSDATFRRRGGASDIYYNILVLNL